jgi:hypothetical protein
MTERHFCILMSPTPPVAAAHTAAATPRAYVFGRRSLGGQGPIFSGFS